MVIALQFILKILFSVSSSFSTKLYEFHTEKRTLRIYTHRNERDRVLPFTPLPLGEPTGRFDVAPTYLAHFEAFIRTNTM